METGKADGMPEVTGLVNRSQREAQEFSLTTKRSAVMRVRERLRGSSFRAVGNSTISVLGKHGS